jgi:hypothetical protein
MGMKKISTKLILKTGKISLLTVPDGGVVLSRPRPTLGCSTHDDDVSSSDMKVANQSFKNVAEFKHNGMQYQIPNWIHEEIKSSLNMSNAYYHAIQNISSSNISSKK